MQDKHFTKLEQEIFDKLQDFLAKIGYTLVDVSLSVVDSQSILAVYVYAKDKMTLNDIAKVSGQIEPILDEMEALSGSYMLEVSSPGINRSLKHLNEFNIFKDEQIKIVTTDGRKIIGLCGGFDNGQVTINNGELISKEKIEKKQYIINVEDISKAKLFS